MIHARKLSTLLPMDDILYTNNDLISERAVIFRFKLIKQFHFLDHVQSTELKVTASDMLGKFNHRTSSIV